METQNVTLSLPRALLKKLKILAARRDTSISGLLSASLEEIVRHDDEYVIAMERAIGRARNGYNLKTDGLLTATREELHGR